VLFSLVEIYEDQHYMTLSTVPAEAILDFMESHALDLREFEK
jgi:hypothetical protein